MAVCSLKQVKKKMLLAALSVLVFPAAASAFSPFVVKDIYITGLKKAEPSMVFGYLPVRVGATFNQELATDSVKRLYASGLFSNVNITTKGNVINIAVQERPTIASILFDGMKAFKPKTVTNMLSNNLAFGEGYAFNPALLERATQEIRKQYIAKGNYSVEITHSITPLPNHRVGISFTVKEGKKTTVRHINFVGNKHISSSTLEGEMFLSTSGFMTWYTNADKFSKEKLDADIERLRSYYLEHGYFNVHIDKPQVVISPNLEEITLNITVHEGEKYTVRNVALAGDLLGMNEELAELIHDRSGETYRRSKIQQSVNGISLRLGELGYALATVNVVPQVVPGSNEVDLTFFVTPGKRIYVRQINIGGNVRTRDQVIRRELRQAEAAWYDAKRLSTSRHRIDQLGYFNDVQVTQTTVPDTDDQVDIHVDVQEKPTGIINFGVGYGSSEKLTFQGGINQDNVFGSGTNIGINFNTSKSNRQISLTHTNPYWTRSGISKTTNVYYRLDRPYSQESNSLTTNDNYKIRSVGAGLNFGIPISENNRVFMGLTLEQNKLKLPSQDQNIPNAYRDFVAHYGQKSTAALFNIGWAKDTRDSVIAPTSGYYTSLNATIGVGKLKYYVLSATQQYFLPIAKDYTLAFNLSADWGRTYGSKGKPFPVIKNMFAGGIGSVRGYEGSSLGPRDTQTGDYLGGNTRLVANVQLFLPFPGTQNDRSLRWFLFADAGKIGVSGGQQCTVGVAGGDRTAEDPCGWRYSAGLGLSWNSPLGPLQISWAKPVHSKKGDNKQQFQFQIGTSF